MPMKTIMTVGSHADDIEINMGATCLKYRDIGYEFVYVMSTNNMSGCMHVPEKDGRVLYLPMPTDQFRKIRESECAAAASVLGTEPVCLGFPQRHYPRFGPEVSPTPYPPSVNNGNIDSGWGVAAPPGVASGSYSILTAHEHAENVKRLAALILENDPEVVFTHSPVMYDPEHIATCMLTVKAFNAAAANGYSGALVYWVDGTAPFYGNYYFSWQTFIDGAGFQDRKTKFAGIHKSMLPHPEKIEYFDFGAKCGCGLAEVFNFGFPDIEHIQSSGPLTAELMKNSGNSLDLKLKM